LYNLDVVKEKIRERIDPVELLEWLGVTNYTYRHGMIRCACPIHKGDGPNNFSFDTRDGIWTCFSRRCGEDIGVPRDIFLLVMLMRNVTFLEAVETLKGLVGLDDAQCQFSKEEDDRLKIKRWLRKQRALEKTKIQEIDESVLAQFDNKPCGFLLDRGFTPETIRLFDVRYADSGEMAGRVVVPVRDDEGRLVGLSGRLVTDDPEELSRLGKWKHMFNFASGSVLFGLDKAKPYIALNRSMVLTEGPFDVMKAFQYGLRNVCATFGVNILPEQIDLVIRYASEVYLAYDGDKRGREGAKRAYDKLNRYADVKLMILSEGRDIADLTDYELWSAYSNAITLKKGGNGGLLKLPC
jgi:DNA primase